MEKSFKAADFWSGLALAALGCYIISEAWRWEYLGPDGPGPGFFPLWYGIAMLALSGALVASSAMRKDAPGAGSTDAAIDWRQMRRALSVWLALAVSIAAFALVGFVVSFALLTFFIITVMYRRPAKLAAMVAAAGAAGFYLLFPLALGVALPTGAFGF